MLQRCFASWDLTCSIPVEVCLVDCLLMKPVDEIADSNASRQIVRAGDLLVAEPFLTDAYFRRAVILLIDHNAAEGSVGLVLNKQSSIPLKRVLRNATCPEHISLHLGGPVEKGRLLYLHTLGERIAGSMALEHGLYIGGRFEDVLQYINSSEYDERRIKFFAGYCGWTQGQLLGELAEGSWAVTALDDASMVMLSHDESSWYETVASLGSEYRKWYCFKNNTSTLN